LAMDRANADLTEAPLAKAFRAEDDGAPYENLKIPCPFFRYLRALPKRGSKRMGEPSPEPEDLLRAARGHDASALGRLLELYRRYLKLLARLGINRQLQGNLDPSDLVQETFLEAHRDFPQFRGTTESELLAWLRQILVSNLANQVRRYLGTKGRDVRLERELAVHVDVSSRLLERGLLAAASSPSQQAARREQAVLLAEALGQLPDDQREVIILRHLEGLTFPEVAARLDRSTDSVKKLWARSLARLRHSLGELP
jgi:RNA polymerase sigma-70 factor (ECF subfamily)